jgi:hypothetical protein
MSLHKKLSLFKSVVRIIGYIIGGFAFKTGSLPAAFFVLTVSELIGILEEHGEK